MKTCRWWLALSYVLATLVAQGAHDHGAGSHEAPAADAGCDSADLHFANHPDAPDLSVLPDACPACHFQSHHPISLSPTGLVKVAGTVHTAIVSLPCAPADHASCHRGRAPPRA